MTKETYQPGRLTPVADRSKWPRSVAPSGSFGVGCRPVGRIALAPPVQQGVHLGLEELEVPRGVGHPAARRGTAAEYLDAVLQHAGPPAEHPVHRL